MGKRTLGGWRNHLFNAASLLVALDASRQMTTVETFLALRVLAGQAST